MIIKHTNIKQTVSQLDINQRGDTFFVVSGYSKKLLMKGIETDIVKFLYETLNDCLIDPEIDKVVIESSAKQFLIVTMRRKGPKEWECEREVQNDERETD